MTHRRLFYCHLHAFHYQLIDPITGTKEKKKHGTIHNPVDIVLSNTEYFVRILEKLFFFCGLRDLLPC